MQTNFGHDLTTGSIPKSLIRFAFPIFLGNLLSSGYSIINTIWIGHLLGGRALGAAAITFPLILMMVALCAGVTTATSVLVARFFGARQNHKIQDIVDNSWSLAAVMAVVLTLAAMASADGMLALMGTPPEIRSLAAGYLRLTFLGFPFMYTAFLSSSTLRAVGNSKIPLLFIALGTVLNAILDPFLIIGWGPCPRLGLNGAALASLVSGSISSVLGFIYLRVKYAATPLYPRRWELDRETVGLIFNIGFPVFLHQALLSLAIGFMTTLVNGFGVLATAAFGVAGRVETLVAMPAMAIMAGVSTVTSQNLGAGKPGRISEVWRAGILINTPVILLISGMAFFAPRLIMNIFVNDPAIIAIGVRYLRYVSVGYCCLIVGFVTNGVIVGSGKTVITLLISVFSLCLARIPMGWWLSRTALGLDGIWMAISASMALNAVLGYVYYRSGRWKTSTHPGPVAVEENLAATPAPPLD